MKATNCLLVSSANTTEYFGQVPNVEIYIRISQKLVTLQQCDDVAI
jgi:hypothetical protein